MRIVMTGATTGIGLGAAQQLSRDGADLVIGARSFLPSILSQARAEPLDLASLASVRVFAEQVGREPVDRLILNAGGQQIGRRVSADGFELTFAVNHLAHYLLVRLLAPAMAADGRIILTASGTHDPEKKTGMPPPHHADARRLAFLETDPELDEKPGVAGRRAYSSSKLLNVMTVRELARRLGPDRPDLMVAAFDPGFTPGTGLARDYPAALRFVFRQIMPIVVRGPRVSTPERSGRLLAGLATHPAYAPSRGGYWAYERKRLREEAPSALARDDAACAKLWADSADLAGLPPD